MPVFTEKVIAEIVRSRLDLESPIQVLWAIPEAMKDLSRKIAANPRKRSLLITDDSNAYPLDENGAILLSSVTDQPLREYLEYGEIWFEDNDGNVYGYPLQPIRDAGYVIAPKGDDFLHWYLTGGILRTRNLDRNQPDALEGNLRLTVPRQMTIADCDISPELQPLLIEKVVEILTGPQNDSAEDGEN